MMAHKIEKESTDLTTSKYGWLQWKSLIVTAFENTDDFR